MKETHLNVRLEVEKVNLLPIGPIQGEKIPRFRHLGTSTQWDDI